MKVKKGIGISEGYAIATVKIIDEESISIPHKYIKKEKVEEEIKAFEKACKSVVKELNKRIKNFPSLLKEESISIVTSYTNILYDQYFSKEIKDVIKTELISAAYAVFKVFKKYINALENVQDEFFRSRASDLIGMRNLLIKKLTEQEKKSNIFPKENFIAVAKRFNLASTINTLIKNLVGIITEEGTQTSHAAIIAKEFGIPAVTALHNITNEVVDGEIVILDGFNGTVILNPTQEAIKKYETLINIHLQEKQKLFETTRKLECKTLDGEKIKICANIEFPDEIQNALNYGADGIGLFRTEFSLNINNGNFPSADELYNKYRDIVEKYPGLDIVFRLFDVGGDKILPHLYKGSPNPFLGVRGIRVYNIAPDLIVNQIKAIILLPTKQVKILIPMVSTVEEVILIKKICTDIVNETNKLKIIPDFKVKLGIMLEVPSTILTIEQFGEFADFFSIGTNDLIQYTFAIDRTNTDVAYLYQPLDRAVLKLIKIAADYCNQHKKDLSVCGEIASDPMIGALLVGLGIKTLSVAPSAIPNLKRTICNLKYETIKEIAKKVMEFSRPQDAYKFLEEQLGFCSLRFKGE